MSGEVAYGQYAESYKAIHSALSGLMAPVSGKKITKLSFTWNGGNVETVKAIDGAELLFTLTFSWSVDGSLESVARS